MTWPEETKKYLTVGIFHRKILNLGKAVELSGMGIWDFIETLGEMGISIDHYDEDKIKQELEATG